MTDSHPDEHISSHGRREAEREQKEEVSQKKHELDLQRQATKNLIWVIVSMAVLVLFAGGIIYLYRNKPAMYTDREVHWHALVDLEICGKRVDLPASNSGDQVHGKNYRGIPLMHTHDDNTIHIEGVIAKKEDIVLGRFFDAIKVPFGSDHLMDKKNGDLCDGKPGVLKMYINNVPRSDFRDYVPIATTDGRKQVIKLVFGPEEAPVLAMPVQNASLSTSNASRANQNEDSLNFTDMTNSSESVAADVIPLANVSIGGSRLMSNASNATVADNV